MIDECDVFEAKHHRVDAVVKKSDVNDHKLEGSDCQCWLHKGK